MRNLSLFFSQNFHLVNQPTIWEAEKNAAEQKSKDERPEVDCGYCSLQTYSFHRLTIFSIFHNTRLICWRLHHNWFSSFPWVEVVCLDSKYLSPYVWLWVEKRDSQRVPVSLKTTLFNWQTFSTTRIQPIVRAPTLKLVLNGVEYIRPVWMQNYKLRFLIQFRTLP